MGRITFFKKKEECTNSSNNTTNLNTGESEVVSDEQEELMRSKLSKMPYLRPCDTISAHLKHTLPQAKELFANREETEATKEKEATIPDEKVAVGEPLQKQDSATTIVNTSIPLPKESAAPESEELNTVKSLNHENTTPCLAANDQEMLISPLEPEALFLSAIPKEFSQPPLPLRKTVSFQECVTTHSHEEFQARLEELRKQKWEERGTGLIARVSYFFKRLFACKRM